MIAEMAPVEYVHDESMHTRAHPHTHTHTFTAVLHEARVWLNMKETRVCACTCARPKARVLMAITQVCLTSVEIVGIKRLFGRLLGRLGLVLRRTV
jgi:hypothetical protein